MHSAASDGVVLRQPALQCALHVYWLSSVQRPCEVFFNFWQMLWAADGYGSKQCCSKSALV